jgi:hypothetical protein
MSKHLLGLILLAFMTVPGWSQEAEPEAGVAATEAPAASDDTAVAEGVDSAAPADVNDDDLDLQTYEEDEDDFVPTEEIPADEPIPFPSNI